MTAVPDRAADFQHLQRSLRAAHRYRVHDLTLVARADGVDLHGEANCFYTIQLVIRDVLIAGVRIRRNLIRVRSAN
jgi:hypothetical protein